MRRRAFLTLCGVAATPAFLRAPAALAQRPRRIALLMASYSPTDREGQVRNMTFVDTLQKLGWVDGRNVRIEYRWTAGDAARTRAAAAELVGSAPDVIVVLSNPALADLHQLTGTIPIVFTQVSDPVDGGYVASLAQPGGNITGFQNFEPAMGGKWLGILKEAAPSVRRVVMLFGSDNAANVAFLHAAEAVARSLAVAITALDIRDGGDVERPVAPFASEGDAGLIVCPHPATVANRRTIIATAARLRMPAIYPYRYFAIQGGLLSYGPDQIEQWRGAAAYVDRILRGEKAGQLPVQAPTKFELVINMKTAKALGLDIPAGLPLRADEVVE